MSSYTCGVGYATKLPVSEVETWLDQNCRGDWHIRLGDITDTPNGIKRKIEVLFTSREDLAAFKAQFGVHERQRLTAGAGDRALNPASGPSMMRPNR